MRFRIGASFGLLTEPLRQVYGRVARETRGEGPGSAAAVPRNGVADRAGTVARWRRRRRRTPGGTHDRCTRRTPRLGRPTGRRGRPARPGTADGARLPDGVDDRRHALAPRLRRGHLPPAPRRLPRRRGDARRRLPGGVGRVEREVTRRSRGPTRSSPTGRCSTASRASTPTSAGGSGPPSGRWTSTSTRLVALRLNEHALHTWDVEVAARPRGHRRAGGHGRRDRRTGRGAPGSRHGRPGPSAPSTSSPPNPGAGSTIVLGTDAVTFTYGGPGGRTPTSSCRPRPASAWSTGDSTPAIAGGVEEGPVLDELRRAFPGAVARAVVGRLSSGRDGGGQDLGRRCRRPPAGARSRRPGRAERSSSPGRGRSCWARSPSIWTRLLDPLGQGDEARGCARARPSVWMRAVASGDPVISDTNVRSILSTSTGNWRR